MVGFSLCIPAGQKNPSKNEERLYSRAYSGNAALTMRFLYQAALGEEYVIHHTRSSVVTASCHKRERQSEYCTSAALAEAESPRPEGSFNNDETRGFPFTNVRIMFSPEVEGKSQPHA